ncbi:MAG: phage terminase large subunit [Prevotella sp.]
MANGVTSRLNLIPPDKMEELRTLLDTKALTIRQSPVWIQREARVNVNYPTVQRWYTGLLEYKFGNYNERKSSKPYLPKKVSRARSNQQGRENLAAASQKIKEAAKTVKKVVKSKKTKVVAAEDVKLGQQYQHEVAFQPNEGPQTAFLAAPETDVLYGGAAGGGKSLAMIVDPLRSCDHSKHRALILRRSLKELRQLIDMSRELYPKAYPGTKFKETEKIWNFPSGAKVEFGYLEKDADVYQYQGQDFSWIGFDEISQLPTEFPWHYLASRLRTSDPSLKVYLRCTTNPGGPGHGWVNRRYLDPASYGTPFVGNDGISRRFIPATLRDNPYLYNDGRYQKMLESLPEVQRRQLLEGDWEIAEGIAFPEFQKNLHVIQPFSIPRGWARTKACDYGFSAPSCVLWGAVDPQDGTVIIYKELYEKGLTAKDLGDRIRDMEMEEVLTVPGVIDHSVFNRTGYAGPTIGEILNKNPYNLKFRPADKNRRAGKIQVHEYFRKHHDSDRPRVQIFSTCTNLIRELSSLILDKNDPEDVDTHMEDHAYDAFRYLLMSRPRTTTSYEMMWSLKREKYTVSDPVFGY